MKTRLNFVVVGVIATLFLGAERARAILEVSASVSIHATADFYAPLAAEGAWIEVGSYGRCWRPARVAVGWRPYCYGRWVWTDCGWYWESDEPWGWACYHYGWWAYNPDDGWFWVPGIEWAPAWVTWRVGVGHIGWAPLPPRGVVVAGPQFVFVESRRFADPVRPSTVIVNNTQIINQTTVVNNLKREKVTLAGAGSREVMFNEGPGVAAVQRATSRKIEPVPIEQALRRTRTPTGLPAGEPKAKKAENSPSANIAPRGTTPPAEPRKQVRPGSPTPARNAIERGRTQPAERPASAERPAPAEPRKPARPESAAPERNAIERGQAPPIERPGPVARPAPAEPRKPARPDSSAAERGPVHPAGKPAPVERPPGHGAGPESGKGLKKGQDSEHQGHGRSQDRESEGRGKPQG